MFEVDIKAIKRYIEEAGVKQKLIAEKSGIGETKLSLILQGKRELKAGEYANICKSIGVPMNKFLRVKNNAS